MGYSITIGELEIEKHEDDGLDCSCISFGAKGVRDDNAPAFGEPTDFTNSRWPSYSAWSDCLRDLGLYDLFYCDGHLIGGHPGVRLVTANLVKEVNSRIDEFKRKNPKATPVYDGSDLNGSLCRGEWLVYWLNWAIKNCKNPVIANS